jgi:hypothetical protein
MSQEAVNVENMTVNFITTRHYNGISRCHSQTKNVNVEDFLSDFGETVVQHYACVVNKDVDRIVIVTHVST